MINTNSKYPVGLLIDSMIGGGAERVTLNLYNAFGTLGHKPHIFLVTHFIEHQTADIQDDRLHYISKTGILSKNNVINKLMLAFKLRKLIHRIELEEKQNFLFFISSSENMDRLTRIAMIPNVIIRYRNSMWEYLQNKIGHHHSLIKQRYKKIYYTQKFRSIYGNRNIVTVSDALHNDILVKVRVHPRTIKTIHNPFNFNWLHDSAMKPFNRPKNPYIIYVARFENRKRHDLLIRAYNIANPSQDLVLIGGIYTESDRNEFDKIKQLIKNLGINDKIIIPGFQQNPYPWIKNADLLAMSSDSEGLPTVLIESLILNTPVVSTDCPTGPSEILTGELAQFLSPPNNAEQLAKNISKALLKYPNIRPDILSKFNYITIGKQYINHALELFLPDTNFNESKARFR